MDKKKVIIQIGDLIEHNCHGCTKNPFTYENKIKRDEFCFSSCNIGKQLQDLGKQITNPNKELKELNLTKEDYLAMKKSGMTDKEIMKDSNMDHNKLYKLKVEWDLIGLRNNGSETIKTEKQVEKKEEVKPNMGDVAQLKFDIKSLTTKNNELKLELEQKDKEIETLKSKNKTLETNVGTLMDIRDKNVEEIQNLKSSLTTIIQELNRVKSEPVTSVGSKINKENKALKAFVRVWLEEEQA